MQPHVQQWTTHISSPPISEPCSPYYRDQTYFYNMETNSWTNGPAMVMTRHTHTCDLVTHVDGTRDIVIVGGRGTTCSRGTNNVEIIHLDSNSQTHRSGNKDWQLLTLQGNSINHNRCTGSNHSHYPHHCSLWWQNCPDGRVWSKFLLQWQGQHQGNIRVSNSGIQRSGCLSNVDHLLK